MIHEWSTITIGEIPCMVANRGGALVIEVRHNPSDVARILATVLAALGWNGDVSQYGPYIELDERAERLGSAPRSRR